MQGSPGSLPGVSPPPTPDCGCTDLARQPVKVPDNPHENIEDLKFRGKNRRPGRAGFADRNPGSEDPVYRIFSGDCPCWSRYYGHIAGPGIVNADYVADIAVGFGVPTGYGVVRRYISRLLGRARPVDLSDEL